MLQPLVLLALSFAVAITAKAQNFSSYVPECAPPCIKATLNSSNVCTGLDDNDCLCTNFGQILFPSIGCFVSSCNATNVQDLRSEITAGYQEFCSDNGTPINFSGPEFTSTPSTITPTPSSTASAGNAGLSTGQKAGIGVGAGVGSLLVIGGLVFLGFRLGKHRNKKGSKDDAGNAPVSNEGTNPIHGPDATHSPPPNWPTAEGGGDVWTTKPQGFVELPSPPSVHAEVAAQEVSELPAHTQPVELWHGVMPSELSADSEIPRNSNTTR
ncbi:hypothetical protein NPX13_g1176 [Xylaria arbuscula]|uniref:CFEM domain-containing protein n=1 Tax=Xylaria arbuscula TaxID=114810 RepID=A0A9W8NMX2_9PEZI|nr:hypothetical protein NPX13_g1176 [Xylaria arbuscula]